MPLGASIELRIRDLEQLYCRSKRVVRGEHVVERFELLAVADGMRHTLIGGLDEAEDALWLEQRIEEHLDLGNIDVPGEAPLRERLGVLDAGNVMP